MLNQKVRYALARRLIRRHRRGSICEVGAGRTGLAQYFPGVTFVGVDLDFDDYGGAHVPLADAMSSVRADARSMPFPDETFDLVFSLDMLEHVPAGGRNDVIRELARITRRDLMVAFPCGAESRAEDLRHAHEFAARGESIPGWLREHLAIDYPMPEEMDRAFAGLGRTVRVSQSDSTLLRRFVDASERSGLPGRALDRWLPFAILSWIDRLGGAGLRRVYHVEMG